MQYNANTMLKNNSPDLDDDEDEPFRCRITMKVNLDSTPNSIEYASLSNNEGKLKFHSRLHRIRHCLSNKEVQFKKENNLDLLKNSLSLKLMMMRISYLDAEL